MNSIDDEQLFEVTNVSAFKDHYTPGLPAKATIQLAKVDAKHALVGGLVDPYASDGRVLTLAINPDDVGTKYRVGMVMKMNFVPLTPEEVTDTEGLGT